MDDTSLFNLDNATFIMVFVFGLVIVALIGSIFLMMNSDKKKQ